MPSDPRAQFARSLDQVERQIDAVGPADLARATPCDEFDVQTLIAHLVAVLRKLAVVTRGGDMTSVPDPATDVAGDGATDFRRARGELDRLWASDAGLDTTLTMAWGTMTGREMLDAYTHELTAHAWDLSRVTGLEQNLEPGLAEVALTWFEVTVPDEDRTAGGPFAPAVPVPDDADAYTRMAAFIGRWV